MKKTEKLYDGITEVKDELVVEAGNHRFVKRPRRMKWIGAVAACLAVALALSALLPGSSGPGSLFPTAYAIQLPEYPDMAEYPGEDAGDLAISKWNEDLRAQYRDGSYADGLQPYLEAAITQFLSDSGGENVICSPLNIYMALAMLAELSGGSSRQEILELLGSDSIETLRQQASDLWNANYRDDGIMQRVLASSLWLNEDISFNQETMETLAEHYYAASYQGEMGSDGFDKALQDWLSQQTGGMLEEQAGGMTLDPETVLALATTVYFKAKWDGGFSQSKTAPGIFHSPSGDVECSMMKRSDDMTYYWSDDFTAVTMSFESGNMWFILPDEGYTPDDLLESGGFLTMLHEGYSGWENKTFLQVHMTVPKFDITSQLNLRGGLEALGVTEVFDRTKADFSPTANDTGMYVSRATHGVRVKIDERGCEAAAYTMIAAPGAPPPPDEEVYFTLDRPFLFCITGANELPLFTGIVNQP